VLGLIAPVVRAHRAVRLVMLLDHLLGQLVWCWIIGERIATLLRGTIGSMGIPMDHMEAPVVTLCVSPEPIESTRSTSSARSLPLRPVFANFRKPLQNHQAIWRTAHGLTEAVEIHRRARTSTQG
jgi:hypothetical protein